MKIFVSSLFILGGGFKENYFGGHDAMKGSRKKFRILTVSDIIQTFHVDVNRICCKSKDVFFKVGFTEMFG